MYLIISSPYYSKYLVYINLTCTIVLIRCAKDAVINEKMANNIKWMLYLWVVSDFLDEVILHSIALIAEMCCVHLA